VAILDVDIRMEAKNKGDTGTRLLKLNLQANSVWMQF
jgi:hypothetical protein